MKTSWQFGGTVIASLVFSTIAAPAMAAGNNTQGDYPSFSFSEVMDAISKEPVSAARSGGSLTSGQLGLHAVEVDGQWAAVDASTVAADGSGAIAAATRDFVDVSWAPVPDADRYRVIVDGQLVMTTVDTAIRYSAPQNFDALHVQVVPVDEQIRDADLPIYGVIARAPSSVIGLSDETAVKDSVRAATTALNYYRSANLYWRAFIPMSRVDAPPVGCTYGAGYEFGGDNRGFSTAESQSYRVAIQRPINWDSPVWTEPWMGVNGTTVYSKSTGDLVDHAYAENGTFEARLLGTDATTTGVPGTYADVRMSMQVGNPFCSMSSIEGAFTIHLERTGSYTIPSGSHRQMPNHEIFITAWTWDVGPGGVAVNPQEHRTMLYQRTFLDPFCLVTLACAPATMSGYAGGF